jgi:two-component system, NarL family, response regulator NreC
VKVVPEKHKIGLLLVDDHAILRGGLKLLIDSEQDMQVLGDTGSAEEAVRLCARLRPDVILLDITLPQSSGLEVLQQVKHCSEGVKVLMLTMHEDEAYLSEAMKLGASGYILKKAADVELLSAIRAVYRGAMVVDPALTQMVVEKLYRQGARGNSVPAGELTAREQEVLRLVALGYSNRQIADSLVISIKTVETHKANIKEKLQLHKRSDLVRYAMEQGLIQQ